MNNVDSATELSTVGLGDIVILTDVVDKSRYVRLLAVDPVDEKNNFTLKCKFLSVAPSQLLNLSIPLEALAGMSAKQTEQDSGSHYRRFYKGIQLDPYRIYDIFGVTDPAAQQAIKKLLAAGKRGNKDFKQDLIEARDALNRRLEMLEEDET